MKVAEGKHEEKKDGKTAEESGNNQAANEAQMLLPFTDFDAVEDDEIEMINCRYCGEECVAQFIRDHWCNIERERYRCDICGQIYKNRGTITLSS